MSSFDYLSIYMCVVPFPLLFLVLLTPETKVKNVLLCVAWIVGACWAVWVALGDQEVRHIAAAMATTVVAFLVFLNAISMRVPKLAE